LTQKVLVTGVNGLIGGEVFAYLADLGDAFDVYGLDRSVLPSARVSKGRTAGVPQARFFEVDLTHFDRVTSACKGMDVVVHLAANPDPDADWDDLLKSNIMGTYHVFEACRLAGVKRVVYASSGQAILGYRLDEPYKSLVEGRLDDVPQSFAKVDHTMPTRPLNAYGSTKVWGEALARTYADAHGLSCLCIRFGWVIANDALPYPHGRDVWCSCRDAVQMVTRCVMAPSDLKFDIFHAFSQSDYLWKDIDHARDVLGYIPQDNVANFV
jgi:NAD+ dependent glucose-6-phosphate dehydrogenase